MTTLRCQQLEFELAVAGILEDVYDLDVCASRDPMNRRSQGMAVLDFSYSKLSKGKGEVEVSVEGLGSTFKMAVDFASSETIVESAEGCEEIAKAVRGFLDENGGSTGEFERRWDDLGF